MAVTGISSSTQTSETTTTEKQRNTTGKMGKDEFLKLLVTQLKYQDPLKPMDDKEFISQMAQFSSLEQMQNMNLSFSSMKAFSLIGKNVAASFQDSSTGEQIDVDGIAQKVKIQNGTVYVTVDDRDIPIDEINNISNSGVEKITDLMTLIGKKVEAVLNEIEGGTINVEGKVTSIKKLLGKDFVLLDDVELKNVDVIMPQYTIEYKKDYMERNIGKEVTVVAADKNGQYVFVTAVLKEAIQREDGNFDVKLDNVEAPVDDLSGISQEESSGGTSDN